ncbi:HAD-like domain containing protein [Cryptosporidium tyzzeri]|nr:HAD-like domain containing protein [Cryptosporidium tyzzeri]
MFSSHELVNVPNKKKRIEGLLGGETTLIIVDWDDTLLPTTYLSWNRQLDLKNTNFGRIVADFLKKATELGQVIIITNAEPRWVYETSELYLPEILCFLRVIPICSARQFTQAGSNDLKYWKYRAFNCVIQQFSNSFQGIANIISIGDSQWDRDAVFNVFENNKNIKIIPKAVKFLGSPSFEALGEEILILTSKLEEIVMIDGANIYEMEKW